MIPAILFIQTTLLLVEWLLLVIVVHVATLAYLAVVAPFGATTTELLIAGVGVVVDDALLVVFVAMLLVLLFELLPFVFSFGLSLPTRADCGLSAYGDASRDVVEISSSLSMVSNFYIKTL